VSASPDSTPVTVPNEGAAINPSAPSSSAPPAITQPPGFAPDSISANNGTPPVRAICRRVTTVATVSSASDNTAELWCRDNKGDWAMATETSSIGG
jgi:hypothetical protein